jgi:hypothetical protein
VYLRVTPSLQGCHVGWARRRDVVRPWAVNRYLAKVCFRFRIELRFWNLVHPLRTSQCRWFISLGRAGEPLSNEFMTNPSQCGSARWQPSLAACSCTLLSPLRRDDSSFKMSRMERYNYQHLISLCKVAVSRIAGGGPWQPPALSGQRLPAAQPKNVAFNKLHLCVTLAQCSPCFSELFFF